MTEEGRVDPLNADAKPLRRWLPQALSVAAVIVVGIVVGARIWQPVKTVEQRITAPIREVVQRASPLDELPDLVEATCPAVVSLHMAGAVEPAPQGVLISGDGFIVTTAPLPEGAAPEIWLNDGRRLPAIVHGRELLSGVTLLKIEGTDFPQLPLAEADLPRPGSRGFTLRSPAGRGCAIEPAIVSSDFATEATTDGYYVRVSHAGSPPPPGTPLLSDDGKILAFALPVDKEGARSDRFLPVDLATTVVSYLIRNADPAPNPFGIIARDLTPVLAARLHADRGKGAVVAAIGRRSPAEQAGLRIGDIILSAGHLPISSASELNRVVAGDEPLEMIVSRSGEEEPRTFTLIAPKP